MGRHAARTGAEDHIGRQIVGGELEPGRDLDESVIATELGVEPAVVREALCGLERDGFVRPAGEGHFAVTVLDEAELRETYPIVLLLEGLAVRTTPSYEPSAITRLRELNAAMRDRAGDPMEAAWRDHAFHAELTRHCGNDQLLATLRPLKRMLLRYEVGYMGSAERVGRSVAQHEELLAALERGDREEAAAVVEKNFRDAMPALLDRF